LSPGIKLLIYSCLAGSLFIIKDVNIHAVISICIIISLFFIPFKKVKGGFLPITLFMLFTFISNLFYQSGRVIYIAGPVTLTDEGLVLASIRTLRVFDMIFAAKVLTATTPLKDMLESLKKILGPLEKTGLPVHDFFAATALTLKCFPLIKQELSEVYKNSIKGTESVSFRDRTRLIASFMIPMFTESIRDPEKFFIQAEERSRTDA